MLFQEYRNFLVPGKDKVIIISLNLFYSTQQLSHNHLGTLIIHRVEINYLKLVNSKFRPT
jgi:hypothetical protein